MAETLVPVDIEKEGVVELNTRMPGLGFPAVVSGTQISRPRPAEFIRFLAVGGTGRDLVTDLATVVIEGFAVTEARAQRICAFGIAALQAAGRDGRIGSAVCYGVSVVSMPQNLPLESVPDRARYTATVSVALRRVTV